MPVNTVAYFYIDDVILEKTTQKPTNTSFQKLEKDTKLTLKNIFFATAKSDLLASSYAELDALAEALKKQPAVKILISGHTDNTGNAAANQTLSAARAKAVADYLVKKGVVANRLTSQGFGATQPIAPNTTDEGKAQNRRVELKVL